MPQDMAIGHAVADSRTGDPDVVYAYRCGHRDARHAAAEIVMDVDARIEEFEAELAEIRQFLIAAGVSESEGGGGDTYYRKDTSAMAKELAQRMNLKCLCGWDYKSHGFYVDCACKDFTPMEG